LTRLSQSRKSTITMTIRTLFWDLPKSQRHNSKFCKKWSAKLISRNILIMNSWFWILDFFASSSQKQLSTNLNNTSTQLTIALKSSGNSKWMRLRPISWREVGQSMMHLIFSCLFLRRNSRHSYQTSKSVKSTKAKSKYLHNTKSSLEFVLTIPTV